MNAVVVINIDAHTSFNKDRRHIKIATDRCGSWMLTADSIRLVGNVEGNFHGGGVAYLGSMGIPNGSPRVVAGRSQQRVRNRMETAERAVYVPLGCGRPTISHPCTVPFPRPAILATPLPAAQMPPDGLLPSWRTARLRLTRSTVRVTSRCRQRSRPS